MTIAAPHLGAAAALWFVLVAVAVAVGTARRPVIAPVALLLADPFALTRYAGATTITTFKAALVGAIAGVIVARPRAGDRTALTRTLLCFAAVAAATLATLPGAAHHAPVLRETVKIVEYTAVCIVAAVASFTIDAAGRRTIAWAAVLAVVAVAVDATRDVLHPQSGVWINGHPLLRLAGHLEGPNQLAAWLGIVLPLALGSDAVAGAATAAAIAGGAALALTLSRTGIAQGVIAAGTAIVTRRPRLRRLPIAFTAAMIVALAVLSLAVRSNGAFGHLMSSESVDLGGTGSRPILWSSAVRMFRAHPLFGVGAGNYELELQQYGAPAHVRTHANSLYLEALADGGIVLGAATIALAVLPPLWLVRAGLRRRDPTIVSIAVAGLALAAHGVFDDVTFFTKVGQAWWTVAGIAIGLAASSPSAAPVDKYPTT